MNLSRTTRWTASLLLLLGLHTQTPAEEARETKITKRPANERGIAEHGWLTARFSFSFAGYRNPAYDNFHSLYVMNNDTIRANSGFDTHSHENMEIFTYVMKGKLEHKDSMGHGGIIEAGNFQYMSAGKRIEHSERNPSQDTDTELYQIWIKPNVEGGEPRYAEKPLGDDAEPNTLHVLFSGNGRDGSTPIRQNAEIAFARADRRTEIGLSPDATLPHVWIQVVKGAAAAFGESLRTGDGLAVENAVDPIHIFLEKDTEILLFRLAD